MKLIAEILRSLIPLWVMDIEIDYYNHTTGINQKIKRDMLNEKNWELAIEDLAKNQHGGNLTPKEEMEALKYQTSSWQTGKFYQEIFNKIDDYDNCVYREFDLKTSDCDFISIEVITTPNDDKIIVWCYYP